jgi:hypothetical protein
LGQVGHKPPLFQPAGQIGKTGSKTSGGKLLVLGSKLSSVRNHQVVDGVALGEDNSKLTLGSGERLAGGAAGAGEVGGAELLERGRGCRAGAELLTTAAVAGVERFATAGRGVLKERLQHPQGMGMEDGRSIAGTELFGRGWVLLAPAVPPLHQQLAVGLGAIRQGAVLSSG